MPLQRKLQLLSLAAWENDLGVLRDLLHSMEEEEEEEEEAEATPSEGRAPSSPGQRRESLGFGPLHCSAAMGNAEMLHSILSANVCDIDEPDKDGNTPLIWAILYACTSASDTACWPRFSSPSFSSSAASPSSSCGEASELGRRSELELVEALIDNGANVNKANYAGETPLLLAVKLGCVEKVNLLLENGADPNIQDINGASCLHYAATLGLETIAASLLRNGAFLNQRDEWDECALHWAVREGGEIAMRIVRMLANHGAELNVRNEDGETPLDLAIETGDHDVAQLLLSLGAMDCDLATSSMALADDSDEDQELVGGAPPAFSSSGQDEESTKVTPGLLAWTAEASQVVQSCQKSLTHLVA